MQQVNLRFARKISLIARASAITIALLLPVGYFLMAYQNQIGALEAETEINARLASQVINANPEMWRFQDLKLKSFLNRRSRQGYPEIRRIIDDKNSLISESVDTLPSPLITRSVPVWDAGVQIGSIQISRSVRPLIFQAFGVFLFGSALGAAIFFLFRTIPLRALNRALADNNRFIDELTTARSHLESANSNLREQANELSRSKGEVQRRYDELQAAQVLRHNIEETLRDRNKELLILRQISETILGSLDLKVILDQVLERAMLIGSFDLGNVRLFDKGGTTLEVTATRGYRQTDGSLSHKSISRASDTIYSRFGEKIFKEPCFEENVQTVKGLRTLKKEGIESFVEVPIRADNDKVLGIIQLGSRTPRKFNREELHLLETIGNHIGTAVQKAQLFEETKAQARELEKASKLQADFSAMIAHDLRSPLMSITAIIEAMSDNIFGDITEEQRKWLQRIQANSRGLVDLVSDFLDVSRLESGCLALKHEPTDLRELVYRNIENYRVLASGKYISIDAAIDDRLPIIHGDVRRLDQVLSNLISNAVKFTGVRGTIEVGARCEGMESIVAWVKDNGEGIPADELAQIFEKYRQGETVKEDSYKGTGLGLVICRMIVTSHGGNLWVESEYKKGSVFFFRLPVAPQDLDREEAPQLKVIAKDS